MGRGNVRTVGKYEGLYYIDNDDLLVFARIWGGSEPESKLGSNLATAEMDAFELDEELTRIHLEDTEQEIVSGLTARFPSFTSCDRWVSKTQRAILENQLFYIAFEDNEWSLAVELLQKEGEYWDATGLQCRHWQTYLRGIRDTLLELFEHIHIRTGAWTSGTIWRGELAAYR
jgi:hypothetical protein